MTTDATYPRPLLVRADWQDLSGPWGFATDPDDVGRTAGWHRDPAPFVSTITVPYPPESELSGVHDTDCPAVIWYRRALQIAQLPRPGERLLLHFGAVDYAAQVWVNGVFLDGHEGGHTPFTIDVTDALVDSGDQIVVVRAQDSRTDGTQPRGKQDWRKDLHGVWYHRTSGIWQPVWTEVVPAQHLTRLDWSTDVADASIGLDVELAQPPTPATRIRVTVSLGEQVLAEQSVRPMRECTRITLTIAAAEHQLDQAQLLWSPASPTLLDAEVEVLEDHRPVDVASSYVGMRSVGFMAGRFLLNGQPKFLRLVLAQNYWPQSHLAAPSAQALRREVELAKELGFDGVRIHQKIEDPRFLAWCDRIGMLVWSEMPSAYEYGPRMIERLTREWLEAVARDRSHPCIVTWVPFNESWGVWHGLEVAEQRHATAALYHLTKAVDSTRPVISNDGWEHTESDIWGLHDYAPDGSSIRRRYDGPEAISRILGDRPPARRTAFLGEPEDRGQPMMLSEIGGLSLRPGPDQAWHGYAAVEDDEGLATGFRELVEAVLDNPDIAGFCWTQLTDTEQERNGLLTADREPKLDPALVRSILDRPAAAAPAEAIDAARRAARAGPS